MPRSVHAIPHRPIEVPKKLHQAKSQVLSR
jgi:hypothetical protein